MISRPCRVFYANTRCNLILQLFSSTLSKASFISTLKVFFLELKLNVGEKSEDVARVGIEPKTFALLARRSNQLS